MLRDEKKPSLLIVDDMLTLRKTLMQMVKVYIKAKDSEINASPDKVDELISKKYDIQMVDGGPTAIKAVESKIKESGASFNLILLDFHMPDMNGDETAKKIREIEEKLEASPCSSIVESTTEPNSKYGVVTVGKIRKGTGHCKKDMETILMQEQFVKSTVMKMDEVSAPEEEIVSYRPRCK